MFEKLFKLKENNTNVDVYKRQLQRGRKRYAEQLDMKVMYAGR